MILVTGSAGFIGFHVVMKLIKMNKKVVGIDNLNSYYDTKLKIARNEQLLKIKKKNFKFYKLDINNNKSLTKLFKKYKFKKVIHLAAQAGIRYSLKNPRQYLNSNIVGFFNILNLCKVYKIQHLVYASSSSVYGANTKIPFSEEDGAQHPIQFYAATKRSNELMAHAYSHLYKIKTTGLRFFTVYGPWGRPDMAVFQFTENLLKDKKIFLYNYGKNFRDFTYIDDTVEGIIKVLDKNIKKKSWNSKKPNPSFSNSPFNVYNLGNNKKISVLRLIEAIKNSIEIKPKIKKIPAQKGDVSITWSNNNKAYRDFDYKPKISIEEGVKKFIKWYKLFYKLK
jgi:UDP-glucuronate 4-epimerase